MNAQRYAVVLYEDFGLDPDPAEVVAPFYTCQQARDFGHSKERLFAVVPLRTPTLKELSLAQVP